VVDDQNLTGYVQTLEEWTADGFAPVQLEKVYDYGLDLVSQTQFDLTPNNLTPKTSYFLYDGHGSVRALADDAGTITDSYTYDAFGIQLSQTGSTDNAYRYCGEYFDVDLGLYYLRARHMNPETGRFHTLDTFEGWRDEPLSLHKYMYAHANPVMGIDPSGNCFDLISLMAGIVQHGKMQSIKAGSSVSAKRYILKSAACAVAEELVAAIVGDIIYLIIADGVPFYLGMSGKGAKRVIDHIKMRTHIKKIMKQNQHVTEWVVDIFNISDWAGGNKTTRESIERQIMDYLESQGYTLKNRVKPISDARMPATKKAGKWLNIDICK
jgi:RHS repeat-associated protein